MTTTLAASRARHAAPAADSRRSTGRSRPTSWRRRCGVQRLLLRRASVPPADARGPAHAAAVPGLGGEPAGVPARGAAEGRRDPLQLPRPRGAPRVDRSGSSITTAPSRAPAASRCGSGSAWRSACRARRWRTSGTCCRRVRLICESYVHVLQDQAVGGGVRLVADRAVRAQDPRSSGSRRFPSTTPGSRPRRWTTSRAGWCRRRAT